MKIKSFLIAALASLAFAACIPAEENLGEAQISVKPTELEFDASGEKSQVVSLVATRDWHIENTPEWLVVNPTNGTGSTKEQAVTVSVDPNKGNDREDEVVFTIGLDKATLKVIQKGEKGKIEKGSGTLEDPYSVAGVIAYLQDLGADVTSPEAVYVKGKVSTIDTDKSGVLQCFANTGSYGNATFFISDDGTANDQFECYRILYLGNKKFATGDTDIKIGDDVVIYGKVVNFKGNTPETSQGTAYLYSLNGETSSTVAPEDPTTVEQITCAEFIQKADGNTTYRLVGKVASAVNTTYCSFDLNDGTATVVVWTVNNKDEWKDKVKQGGTVTVRGKYLKYEQNGTVKHEMVDAYIEKFEEGTTVDYNNAPAKTIAEFITAADKETYYKLTGVVSGFNSTYCSMDITDASGSIYVYSVSNKTDWASKISNGGTVVLAGTYDYFAAKNQHEVVNAYILSFTEGQGGGEAKGTGTLEDPFNADGAMAYIKANGDKESTEDVYVKGKISSIKNTFDAEHGTAIFNISDDATATATQFTAYSVLYLENRAWEAGDAQVAVGDEVILCGKVTCYNGTYETSSKKAYIYSINGKTTIAQTPVFGVEKTEISVGAAATSATIKVIGNVAWTASGVGADGTAITVDPASGTGKGTVTATLTANESTEAAKTYRVTLTTTADVAEKTITVVITQDKKSAAGEGSVTMAKDALAAAAAGGASIKMDDVISFTNSSSYSGSVTELRIYKSQKLTITAVDGYVITGISFTCTAKGTEKYGPGCFAAQNGYSVADEVGTWTGEASSVVFTAESNQVRIVELKVAYKVK